MTEMSPLGSANASYHERDRHTPESFAKLRQKAGKPIFGVEMKIVDDDGKRLPWDGEAYGSLMVRGPWICSGYFKLDKTDSHTDDGWFETGDVATIDPQGYDGDHRSHQGCDQVRRRVDLLHRDRERRHRSPESRRGGGDRALPPEVVGAAAAGGGEGARWRGPHPEEMLAWFDGKIAKWWTPDAVEFIDELPHGATGKIQKVDLREHFKDYAFKA